MDHDVSSPGPTLPKLSVLAMHNKTEVNAIKAFFKDKFVKLRSQFTDGKALSSSQAKKAKKYKLDNENARKWCLAFQCSDNYRTKPQILAQVYETVGWEPIVDLCSNLCGSNSVAILYFDAMSDGTKQ